MIKQTALFLISAFVFITSAHAEKISVVATTGYVADVVRAVGGDEIELTQLCGPGVDPHLYKPTPSDIAAMRRADAVFYNGLHLEGRMTDILVKMARSKVVLPITDDISRDLLLEPEAFEGNYDPHVWNDPSMWKTTPGVVARGLSEVAPDKKALFEKAAEAYAEKISMLHDWCIEKANELPKEKRILITSHDAYNYLGRALDFQVIAPQGISTVGEAGSADIVKTIDFIRENGVKAIFVETSVSPKVVERIAKDSGARIGGELFSDAMGAPGEMHNSFDTGLYEGLIKYNLTTIVEALK
ncbi:MAG: zinc ABC transporter substrate-binding protein [Candidatus Omnitrophica bacterium]|nr:zinc ABC transporter substrate-binding protein [Candidatus Omnitrophota bacterium]